MLEKLLVLIVCLFIVILGLGLARFGYRKHWRK